MLSPPCIPQAMSAISEPSNMPQIQEGVVHMCWEGTFHHHPNLELSSSSTTPPGPYGCFDMSDTHSTRPGAEPHVAPSARNSARPPLHHAAHSPFSFSDAQRTNTSQDNQDSNSALSCGTSVLFHYPSLRHLICAGSKSRCPDTPVVRVTNSAVRESVHTQYHPSLIGC